MFCSAYIVWLSSASSVTESVTSIVPELLTSSHFSGLFNGLFSEFSAAALISEALESDTMESELSDVGVELSFVGTDQTVHSKIEWFHSR